MIEITGAAPVRRSGFLLFSADLVGLVGAAGGGGYRSGGQAGVSGENTAKNKKALPSILSFPQIKPFTSN